MSALQAVLFCAVVGLFCSTLNLAFLLGDSIKKSAEKAGASAVRGSSLNSISGSNSTSISSSNGNGNSNGDESLSGERLAEHRRRASFKLLTCAPRQTWGLVLTLVRS